MAQAHAGDRAGGEQRAVSECTTKEIDLGGGIQNAEVRFIDGVPDGLYYEHPCVNGRLSPGYVGFDPPWRGEWKLISVEPLTISPSLLCRACGHHGFVRGGKWVPA